MPPRPGPSAHDYPLSPPSADNHDPFNHTAQQRYYDNDSENPHEDAYRRDTYGSDSSNPGEHERYYDQNAGPYDPYREWGGSTILSFPC
jgi:hypothetical protein